MRFVTVAAACLLASGAVMVREAAAVGGAPSHEITSASPKALRAYLEALRNLHLGRLPQATEGFRDTIKRDPACAMAHWGLSRTLLRAGNSTEALASATKAEELVKAADDREQRMVRAWAKFVKAQNGPEGERTKAFEAVRGDLDQAISLYPDDPELWLLRGDVEQNPLRSTPFYLAGLRLQPTHPFGTTWSPKAPPASELQPQPSQPVPPLQEAPQLFEGLGILAHPVTTKSPQAQAQYEQGLRNYHGYITPASVRNSAARSFQHAITLDPEFAMAHWGLSLSVNRLGSLTNRDMANRALELAIKNGNDKERRYASARVLELSGPKSREQFLDALDGAIAAYPEDVELWIWRGKSSGGASAVSYQLAAHRLRPEHLSPNHELVHLYEMIDRPALGWPYTEGFRRSAYNMPHAHHMQAHLAMRLGRWQEAIDCTRMSRRKSLEGFPELDPSHHIDILVRALAHEGRFKEAEAEPQAYRMGLPWARLLQLKAQPAELAEWAERRRGTNAPDGFYIGALVELDRNNLEAAVPFMNHVEEQFKKQPENIYRWNEVRGRYLVQSGAVDEGLKMLQESAAKAVKDSGLHAWGGGSYILEVWGEAALRARRLDVAEEAFHEALAHEHGSIVGALGMQVVWEQRGRSDMAGHYARRAAGIWKDADPGSLERQLERLRKLGTGSVAPAGVKN